MLTAVSAVKPVHLQFALPVLQCSYSNQQQLVYFQLTIDDTVAVPFHVLMLIVRLALLRSRIPCTAVRAADFQLFPVSGSVSPSFERTCPTIQQRQQQQQCLFLLRPLQ